METRETGNVNVSSNGTLASHEEDRIYRKILWRLIPLLFVCYIVAYLDRINIGVAKLRMLGDLQFNNSIYAFGASVFFWGYIIFELPSNILLDRIGARIWIARIMISWGIVSTAIAFVEPLAHAVGIAPSTMFYLLRFLLGACEAGFAPGVVLYLSYWFPSRRQSQVLAAFFLALPIGTMIGAPLSGWILEAMNGALNLRGWQWMFVVEGLPAVMMGFVVFFCMQDRPHNARWLSESEKALVEHNLTQRQAETKHQFSAALTDIRIWLLCGIYLTYATGFYGLAFWLPTIIQSAGVKSSFDVGMLTAIPYAIAAVYMCYHAHHSRKTGERRLHVALPVLIGGIGLILSAVWFPNLVISLFFMTIAVSGLMAVMTVIWSLPAGFLSGTAAAAGIAIVSSVGSLSGILGSFVSSIAFEVTGTMKSGTYVLGALMVLSGLIALLAPRSTFGDRKIAPQAEAPDGALAVGKISRD
ncbi:MFS transporter [Caballeronia sp. GAWG2-1]|uniref:MFS transporter n=1 Tax=Caballeronia sp. GAWG2-1 TaxID=2921744 RepID=UPI0020279430|nr:MFS transporter [Caballeronia sp. GAWG2-1]